MKIQQLGEATRLVCALFNQCQLHTDFGVQSVSKSRPVVSTDTNHVHLFSSSCGNKTYLQFCPMPFRMVLHWNKKPRYQCGFVVNVVHEDEDVSQQEE